jgi:hypothetical protein
MYVAMSHAPEAGTSTRLRLKVMLITGQVLKGTGELLGARGGAAYKRPGGLSSAITVESRKQ